MRGWFARLHDDVDLYRETLCIYECSRSYGRRCSLNEYSVFNMIDGRDDFRMTIILIANVVLYAFMLLSASYIYGENYNV